MIYRGSLGAPIKFPALSVCRGVTTSCGVPSCETKATESPPHPPAVERRVLRPTRFDTQLSHRQASEHQYADWTAGKNTSVSKKHRLPRQRLVRVTVQRSGVGGGGGGILSVFCNNFGEPKHGLHLERTHSRGGRRERASRWIRCRDLASNASSPQSFHLPLATAAAGKERFSQATVVGDDGARLRERGLIGSSVQLDAVCGPLSGALATPPSSRVTCKQNRSVKAVNVKGEIKF